MRGEKRRVALFVLACAVSCSKDPPPPPPAPVTTASSPAAADAAPPPLDFHVVARGKDGMALSAVIPANLLVASNLVFSIADGRLRQAPELGRGAPKAFVASGRFPDAVWMAARIEAAPEGDSVAEPRTVSFKWTATGWVETATLRDGESFAGIAPWTEGRSLALVRMGAYDVRFALVGGKGPVALPAPAAYAPPKEATAKPAAAAAPAPPPAPSPASADGAAPSDAAAAALADAAPSEAPPVAVADAGEAEGAKCKTAVHLPVAGPEPLRTLAAFPSGEVLRVGYECRQDEKLVLAVERWAAKQRKSTIETLPEVALTAPGAPLIFARGPEDARVAVLGAARGWLAELAGGKWSAVKLPFTTPISDATLSTDGAFFVATASLLYRQEKAGAPFVQIAVPEVTAIERVHATTKDDVWLVGKDASGVSTLLHSRAAAGVVELPAAAHVAGMQQSNKRSPATLACDRVYVHVQTLGPSGAKPPASFPKLAAALKTDPALGKLEPVIEDDGANTYLGVKAPSLELARKLVAALGAEKKAAAPQIFCHEPKVKNKTPLAL
jgi:hypothetical protein